MQGNKPFSIIFYAFQQVEDCNWNVKEKSTIERFDVSHNNETLFWYQGRKKTVFWTHGIITSAVPWVATGHVR